MWLRRGRLLQTRGVKHRLHLGPSINDVPTRRATDKAGGRGGDGGASEASSDEDYDA